MNEDELAEVMAEEAEGVDKRDPYAFGLGKKVRLLNGSWSSCSPRVLFKYPKGTCRLYNT